MQVARPPVMPAASTSGEELHVPKNRHQLNSDDAAQLNQKIALGKQTVRFLCPRGIGGWLLYFCIELTIVGPLVWLGRMGRKLYAAGFRLFPSITLAVMWESFGFSLLVIYSVAVGWIIGGWGRGRFLVWE